MTDPKEKKTVYKLCLFGNRESSSTPVKVPNPIISNICNPIPEYFA